MVLQEREYRSDRDIKSEIHRLEAERRALRLEREADERRRQFQAAQADRKTRDRCDEERTGEQRPDDLGPGLPEIFSFLQVDLDHDDRKKEQHAGREQGRNDRGRRALRPGRVVCARHSHLVAARQVLLLRYYHCILTRSCRRAHQ